MTAGISCWNEFRQVWDVSRTAAERLGLVHFLAQSGKMSDEVWGGPTLYQLVTFCLVTMEQCREDIEIATSRFDWATQRTIVDIFRKCLLMIISEYESTRYWSDCKEEQLRLLRMLADKSLYETMDIDRREPYTRLIRLFLDRGVIGLKRPINNPEPIPDEWYLAAIYSGSSNLLRDRVDLFREDALFGILIQFFKQKMEAEKKTLTDFLWYAQLPGANIDQMIVLLLFLAKQYNKLDMVMEMM
jgi:hypothetical protein